MGYFYLYDSYLQDRAYANLLIKLETTLTDLGLQGRVGRLTLLKSSRDLVEAAVRDGAETVVAVGNDITLSQVANALAKHPKVALGFIPLGQAHQAMAKILGIPQGLLACHVLSGRLTQTVNLAKINNQYFIQSVVAKGVPRLECEGSFRINLSSPHQVKVCNLDFSPDEGNLKNPGHLNVVLHPKLKTGWAWWGGKRNLPSSLLPIQNLRLAATGEEIPLLVDGYKTLKTPATISLSPIKLKLIVGKKRLLSLTS